MEWSEDAIGQLTALWAEGHSTAEIGRRMGVSKNAVVGKAHRLNLLARPSPIRRGGPSVASRAGLSTRRPVGCTLPPLASPPVVTRLPAMQESGQESGQETVRETPAPEPRRAPAPVAAPPAVERPAPALRHVPTMRSGRVSACCWPIGEPGRPSFRFCDGEAMAGKPYCAEHAQLAYVKVRDRREEAA
jgi:GcrA cell cycle regulator